MKTIEVLGVGCPNCRKTEKLIRKVVDQRGWVEGTDYAIVKVTDPSEIAARGVLATPGVTVDGELKNSGKVPSTSMIESWLP